MKKEREKELILNKVKKILLCPWIIVNILNTTVVRYILPDKLVISCRFRTEFGRRINLKEPRTFNEKLQWLKLYDRKPHYCKMVDKYDAKEIVANAIGNEYIIPTLGIWEKIEEIDFDSLPESFVLKTTHDSHSVIICKEKKDFNFAQARESLQRSLRYNYFYGGREWPYKSVKPRIIAEEYVPGDETGLTDYKIHCFNGEPQFVLVCRNRYTGAGLQEVFYDLSWKKIPVKRPECCDEIIDIEQPESLNEMLDIAENLSSGIPFLRVDFYQYKGNVYFGEFTFFPASGYKHFVPETYDNYFGSLLDLSRNE